MRSDESFVQEVEHFFIQEFEAVAYQKDEAVCFRNLLTNVEFEV